MKISKQNYFDSVNILGVQNLSPAVKKAHEFIGMATENGTNWSAYKDHQKIFDMQFEAIERLLAEKQISAKKPKEELPEYKEEIRVQKKPKSYPSLKKKEQPVTKKQAGSSNDGSQRQGSKKKKPFEKPKVKGKGVELISPEVSFIKRFVSLNNKTKTKDQVGAFIRSLQKAIIERRIRKTSRYANVIREIQGQLVKTYKKMGNTIGFEFEPKDLNRYYKIAGAEIVMPSIRFIKSFVSLTGKEVTKHKAKNLLDRINKAIAKKMLNSQDKYYREVKTVVNSLQSFLNQQGGKLLSINERQLNGLEGILADCGFDKKKDNFESLSGLEESPVKSDNVLTVEEVRNKKYEIVPITDPWLTLLGKICLPTSFFISGMGGSGKSTWALLFSQYMASLGYKILYIAKDQLGTPAFTDLLNRLDIVAGDNFKITGDLTSLDPKEFHFVVIDNKDDLSLKPKHFENIKVKYPEQTFILLSRATKSGDFTGSGEWRNIVDVMLLAEDGVIKSGHDKNRWGGKGEMKLF